MEKRTRILNIPENLVPNMLRAPHLQRFSTASGHFFLTRRRLPHIVVLIRRRTTNRLQKPQVPTDRAPQHAHQPHIHQHKSDGAPARRVTHEAQPDAVAARHRHLNGQREQAVRKHLDQSLGGEQRTHGRRTESRRRQHRRECEATQDATAIVHNNHSDCLISIRTQPVLMNGQLECDWQQCLATRTRECTSSSGPPIPSSKRPASTPQTRPRCHAAPSDQGAALSATPATLGGFK